MKYDWNMTCNWLSLKDNIQKEKASPNSFFQTSQIMATSPNQIPPRGSAIGVLIVTFSGLN